MQPLNGITVVDLSQNLAGPYCTQTLADLGATVLKVEPPGGDPARAWGPPFMGEDSTLFRSANRHKTSITLDLKNADDRNELHKHVATADVFVQSFRKGVIERLGFGEQNLRQQYDRLIYCTVAAYGREGPLSDQPGYDPLMQAHAGLMSVTGHPGMPARVGTSIIDIGTGLWAAIGVLAALRERDVTGKGTHVEAALYETALAWNAYHILGYVASGVVPGPVGTGFPLIAPYDAFETTDGRLMIAAANDNLFARLCAALELDELKHDDRLRSNPDRVANRSVVNDAVTRKTRELSTKDLEERLRRFGVPCAPLLTVDQVTTEAQTIASGMLQRDESTESTNVAIPLLFDGVRPASGHPPPRPT